MDFDKRISQKPVGWETQDEWELEQRAFNWNKDWSEKETRALINDLWIQYCFAANPEPNEKENLI